MATSKMEPRGRAIPPLKPVLAQPKMALTTSRPQPVFPAIFRPTSVQLKAAGSPSRVAPAAPPVYRPGPSPLNGPRSSPPMTLQRLVLQRSAPAGTAPSTAAASSSAPPKSFAGLVKTARPSDLSNPKIYGDGIFSYQIPSGVQLQIGDKVSFELPGDKQARGAVPVNVQVTGQDSDWAGLIRHPDLSAQINPRTATVVTSGSRAEAHHTIAVTTAHLRAYTGAVQKTTRENLAKNGWVYSVPFKAGNISFNYDSATTTIAVFHSFDQKSG